MRSLFSSQLFIPIWLLMFVSLSSWGATTPLPIGCNKTLAHLHEDWTNDPLKEDRIRETWVKHNFSDPAFHNPNNFLYIIKSIRGYIDEEIVLAAIKALEK